MRDIIKKRDQVHIRNAEATELARTLARQTGKTISEVVLDALRHYRLVPTVRTGRKEIAVWWRLLREATTRPRKTPAPPSLPTRAGWLAPR